MFLFLYKRLDGVLEICTSVYLVPCYAEDLDRKVSKFNSPGTFRISNSRRVLGSRYSFGPRLKRMPLIMIF